MVDRPKIPDRTKVDIVIRQSGKCSCGCRKRLASLDNTEFDHDPPLALRPWNEDRSDRVPPANDPEHITAMRFECHKLKTNGPRGPHTCLDGDKHAIAHTNRARLKNLGAVKRKSRVMDGSRGSRFRKRMNGQVELR